jgi:hypothetical protein
MLKCRRFLTWRTHMIKFLKNNWKKLTVAGFATTAAALCIFYPPAFISAGIIALSSSPFFSVFGGYAAAAATGFVAAASAAITFLAATVIETGLKYAGRLFNFCMDKFSASSAVKKGARKSGAAPDSADMQLDGGPRAMGAMGGDRKERKAETKLPANDSRAKSSLNLKSGKRQDSTDLDNEEPQPLSMGR